MKRAGIYQIRNTVNDHIYVGSSVDLNRRRYRHFRELQQNYHHCLPLTRAYAKYGADTFVFEVLEVIEDISILREREQYYLDTLKPAYNVSHDAEPIKSALKNVKHRPWTEEEKLAIAARLKGRKRSLEAIALTAAARRGMKHSEATRATISEKVKLLWEDPDYRKNISQKLKDRKIEPEIIARAVAGRAGYRHSEETKRKIAESAKGRIIPEHVREANRQSKLGKSLSEETKAKMRASQAARRLSEKLNVNGNNNPT